MGNTYTNKNAGEIKKMQGRLSAWLVKHGIIHRSLGFDYQGIETLQIKPEDWQSIAVILYVYGYNYLRSQCAYDVAPGGQLASVFGLTHEYRIGRAKIYVIKIHVQVGSFMERFQIKSQYYFQSFSTDVSNPMLSKDCKSSHFKVIYPNSSIFVL